jgi:hypothetical protein
VTTTNTTPDPLHSCPPAARRARVERKTKESDIVVDLDLDGTGRVAIDTGVPFFDHMLTALGTHASFDLTVTARGDVEIEGHHTVEDTAIVLGTALGQALGDKKGIRRFGDAYIPMDETLAHAAVGRIDEVTAGHHVRVLRGQIARHDEVGVGLDRTQCGRLARQRVERGGGQVLPPQLEVGIADAVFGQRRARLRQHDVDSCYLLSIHSSANVTSYRVHSAAQVTESSLAPRLKSRKISRLILRNPG